MSLAHELAAFDPNGFEASTPEDGHGADSGGGDGATDASARSDVGNFEKDYLMAGG